MPAKNIYRLDINDPELERKLGDIHSEILHNSSKEQKKLGKILARRSLFFFKRFLKKHNLLDKVPSDKLALFMDYLTINRLDLRHMAQDARTRLREAKLEDQPPEERTRDYIECIEHGCDMHPNGEPWSCKHCQWFVEAPPDEVKSCVALGTKGIDMPCYGFIKSKNLV